MSSASPAPIALFVYNRPAHTRRTVEALQLNRFAPESDLFIFADGAKSAGQFDAVNEVRDYIARINGFKSVRVFARNSNAGLGASIIDGVTQVCGERGRVIVLEDDLVTCPWFLEYMNRGLALYENDAVVASVHGYCYPVKRDLPETFFLRGADCWGWGTWGRAWTHFEKNGTTLLNDLVTRGLEREFDLDGAFRFGAMLRDQIAGKNDSWAVRWHASCFLRNMLTLYPGRTLVLNIGNDASGTHSQSTDEFISTLATRPVRVERIDLIASEEGRSAYADFWRSSSHGAILRRLTGFFKRWPCMPKLAAWVNRRG
jgi:hypothetical protein